MDLDFSEDQTMLLDALDRLLERHAGFDAEHAAYTAYRAELRADIAETGFLAIAGEEGFGPLDAALLVERAGRLACSAEVAASALVGPLLGANPGDGIAMCEGIAVPTRFLTVASLACIRTDAGLVVAPISTGDVIPLDTVIAYPIGMLNALPAGARLLDTDTACAVEQRWRLAVAAEAAGVMRGALDATVGFVKDRWQFGQPLGDFQAVQHRLARCEQIVSAARWLALRAAHSLIPADALTALTYIQQNVRTVIYDCHQFTGAMGLTLEYPLHLWTYRLKLLQGELGGWTAQARELADALWDDAGNRLSAARPAGG